MPNYRKTTVAARELGATYSQLHNLIRNGKLVPPPKDTSGDLIWGDEDIERARQALATRRPRRRKAVTEAAST